MGNFFLLRSWLQYCRANRETILMANEFFLRALYEKDILLFATLLCLNIESEGTENFSNEEMSLLLQGLYTVYSLWQFCVVKENFGTNLGLQKCENAENYEPIRCYTAQTIQYQFYNESVFYFKETLVWACSWPWMTLTARTHLPSGSPRRNGRISWHSLSSQVL